LFTHFKDLFGETNTNVNNDDLNDSHDSDLDSNITIDEVRKAVYSQNNNKAPGTDCILGEMIKSSYDTISPFLLTLYNNFFNSGEYPTQWGEGIIAPVFKKSDVNEAKNYRGITLINILAKIYSQILLNRLTAWSDKHDKLSKNQFGFQKGKSIIDCIFILHSVIMKVLTSTNKLYCIFIDYQQCFDKIDRSYLWQGQCETNIPLHSIKNRCR